MVFLVDWHRNLIIKILKWLLPSVQYSYRQPDDQQALDKQTRGNCSCLQLSNPKDQPSLQHVPPHQPVQFHSLLPLVSTPHNKKKTNKKKQNTTSSWTRFQEIICFVLHKYRGIMCRAHGLDVQIYTSASTDCHVVVHFHFLGN